MRKSNWLLSVVCLLGVTGGCANESSTAVTREATIVDLSGASVVVRVSNVAGDEAMVSADLRLHDRAFTAAVWTEAQTHRGVVESADGALRYEYVTSPDGSSITLEDAAGQRTLGIDATITDLDLDAATLVQALMNHSLPLLDSTSPYGVCCEGGFVCDTPGTGIGGCSDWRLVIHCEWT